GRARRGGAPGRRAAPRRARDGGWRRRGGHARPRRGGAGSGRSVVPRAGRRAAHGGVGADGGREHHGRRAGAVAGGRARRADRAQRGGRVAARRGARPGGPVRLAVERLSVRYGNVTALREVDLTVAGGEVVALIGEAGSGRSRLLDAVLGVLPPSAAVSGTSRPDRLRRGVEVGYVAQDPFGSCDPVWTVGHHVAEAWRAHGQRPPRGHIARRLAALGVAPGALRRRPHTWSGGMLQRADLVAATAHAPPLLLADEPTSALDADAAEA